MLHRILYFPDANNEVSSSDTFGTASDMQNADVNNSEESSASQGAAKEPTMAEAIEQALEGRVTTSTDKSTAEKEKEQEELRSKNEQDLLEKEKVDKEKEDSVDQANADDKGKEKEEETVVVDDKEKQLVEGKPVPYERFSEINTQLKTIRQELDHVKPAVENYRQIDTFCKSNSITPEQFGKNLQIQAMINQGNIEGALKELMPLVDSLKGFTGDVLPSDLQTAVDSGDLTLKYAKEVAAGRARLQFGEKKIQHDQQAMLAQQQAIVQRQLSDAVATWEEQRRNADPDYKPKPKPTDPDGKWEKVKREFLGMIHETDTKGNFVRPVKSPSEFTNLLEEAYKSVDSYAKRISAPKPVKKPLRSDRNSSNGHLNSKSIEDAPTLQEAVARGLALRR